MGEFLIIMGLVVFYNLFKIIFNIIRVIFLKKKVKKFWNNLFFRMDRFDEKCNYFST